MTKRRVVITGLGIVAPGGIGIEASWQRVLSGKSAAKKITLFDTTDFPVNYAAEVNGFEPSLYFDEKEARKTTRFIQFSVAASQEAIKDSGILSAQITPHRIGCSVGVGMGSLPDIEAQTLVLKEKGPRRVSPFFIPYAIANMAAGVVAMRHNLQGPNISTTTACTSGTHGIGEAFKMIQAGRVDAMVAGGAESAISPLGVAGFSSLKALASGYADNPEEASRPFDAERCGFVIGEGAGILVLEELESAQNRGAKIYAELLGYGASADAYHITSPSPEGAGAQVCMRIALEDAEINPEQVDYINAHGTSTKLNDSYESMAIGKVFGEHAKSLAISSTKGVTGHCLGGAGGIEAVFSVLTIHRSLIPPTANWQTRDPECPWDYIPNIAREKQVSYVLSNSFGFGGTNGTLVFKKF